MAVIKSCIILALVFVVSSLRVEGQLFAKGEDGSPVKVVVRANPKSAEYAQRQGLRDIQRARGRRLKVGDEIYYSLGGSINSAINPAASGTTEFESCEGQVCTDLAAQTPQYGCNVEHRGVVNASDTGCEYWYAYGDNSSTFGNLATDFFDFQLATGEKRKQRVLFGCSSIQDGNLNDGTSLLDGLMGLGGGSLSVVHQLEKQGVFDNSFALCLEGESTGGQLFLGTNSLPDNAHFIKLLGKDGDTFYRVDLVGLRVASKSLAINASLLQATEDGLSDGTILDSGTTYTLLPTSIWTALVDADLNRDFPVVGMVFGNGTKWNLPPSSYLFAMDDNKTVCIAAQDAGEHPTTIIASSWMRNFFVLHDRTRNRIGFVPFNSASPGASPSPPAALPPSPTNTSTNAPPTALAVSAPPPSSPPATAGSGNNSTNAPKSGSTLVASILLAALACIASGAFAI
eukprot:jgi/Mesen1/5372/ME000268S04573